MSKSAEKAWLEANRIDDSEIIQAHQDVCDAAEWLLRTLPHHTKGDVDVGMAALALALCSLARAEPRTLHAEIHRLIDIAFAELED